MKGKAALISARVDDEGGEVLESADIQNLSVLKDHDTALVLVHGFNNDLSEANKAYRSFACAWPQSEALRRIHIYWPGDADFGWLDWFDFLSYPDDIRDARKSAPVLARALAGLTGRDRTSGMKFIFIGHSMGCRLILEMLKLVEERKVPGWTPDDGRVELVCLMAAAVPTDLVKKSKELVGSTELAEKLLVLFSPHDEVLSIAFPLGQALAKFKNIEKKAYLKAVGLWGKPRSLTEGAGRSRYQIPFANHGDYWQDDKYIVIDHVLSAIGRRPPRATPTATITAHGGARERSIRSRPISGRGLGGAV